jgi:hypothetical protein
MKFISNRLLANLVILILLICAAFLIYHPSFLNPNYFWDDERFVFMNPEVLNAKSWLDFWDRDSVFFRSWPIGYSLFWSLIKYSPFQSIVFYKSINICVHGLNTFLLYRVFKKVNLIQPLFLSLFFLVHPLHVEAVSWIFQLLLLVSFSFFILSFLFILNFVNTQKISAIILAFVFFLMSLWTKSSALLAPIFLVYVFWYYDQKPKIYLFLIPFFFVSLVIGLDNVDGTKSFLHKGNINESIAVFKKDPKPLVNPDAKYLNDKERFDDVYSVKDIKPKSIVRNEVLIEESVQKISKELKTRAQSRFVYKSSNIFSQGMWHYLSKTLMPVNLQFMYPQIVPNILFPLLSFAVLFLMPAYFYFKNKYKAFLLVPVFSIAFLAPYLGLNEITFFFWSNVSDRYSYYFLAVFPILIGLIFKNNETVMGRRLLLCWLFLLICLNFNYGTKFNRPEKLYTEIITYKENPVIYKLLFDQYLQLLDQKKAEEALNKGLELFPNDPFLIDGKFQLENFKKNFILDTLK